jgi:hypothetical protein
MLMLIQRRCVVDGVLLLLLLLLLWDSAIWVLALALSSARSKWSAEWTNEQGQTVFLHTPCCKLRAAGTHLRGTRRLQQLLPEA